MQTLTHKDISLIIKKYQYLHQQCRLWLCYLIRMEASGTASQKQCPLLEHSSNRSDKYMNEFARCSPLTMSFPHLCPSGGSGSRGGL